MTNHTRSGEPVPSIPALTLALLLFFVATSLVVQYLAAYAHHVWIRIESIAAIALAATTH
jgi:hypothetical protein